METAEERSRRQTSKVIRLLLIAAAAVFILLVAFFVFKVHSEGRFALRDAKNVRLAMMTSDIELYGVGKCIYAPEHMNGLAERTVADIERYAGVKDGVTLLSYDRKNREILKFTYKTSHYLVTFTYDGEVENWTVDYLWRIFVY